MKIFKILIICILFSFISCNTGSKQGEKAKPDATTNLEKDVERSEKIEINFEALKTFGSFDTKKDSLYLNVPVSTKKFKIEEIRDISAQIEKTNDSLNAIIIRVSDGTSTQHGDMIRTTLDTTLSMRSLNLKLDELRKDKKLLVITLNSMDALSQTEIKDLQRCMATLKDYTKPEACNYAIRDERPNEEGIFKPNSRKGSVINSL